MDARAAPARSGDRVAIADYLGPGQAFDAAIAAFAEAYAEQNERDYRALGDAVKTGRVAATPGCRADLDSVSTAYTTWKRECTAVRSVQQLGARDDLRRPGRVRGIPASAGS